MVPFRRTVLFTILMVTLALPTAGSAVAASPDREVFHDQDPGDDLQDFCGDLTVRRAFDFRGSVMVGKRGAAHVDYFQFHAHGFVSWTNLANGKTMTDYQNYIDKDLKVVDNGDGTLTITGLATGGERVMGPNGKLILNDPGQIRYQILIDDGGTPADSSDDEFIEDLGVIFGSTGRNDWQNVDFCEFVHATIG